MCCERGDGFALSCACATVVRDVFHVFRQPICDCDARAQSFALICQSRRAAFVFFFSFLLIRSMVSSRSRSCAGCAVTAGSSKKEIHQNKRSEGNLIASLTRIDKSTRKTALHLAKDRKKVFQQSRRGKGSNSKCFPTPFDLCSWGFCHKNSGCTPSF